MCNLYTYRVTPDEVAGLMAHFALVGQQRSEVIRRRNAPIEDVYPNHRAPVLIVAEAILSCARICCGLSSLR